MRSSYFVMCLIEKNCFLKNDLKKIHSLWGRVKIKKIFLALVISTCFISFRDKHSCFKVLCCTRKIFLFLYDFVLAVHNTLNYNNSFIAACRVLLSIVQFEQNIFEILPLLFHNSTKIAFYRAILDSYIFLLDNYWIFT